MRCPGKCGMKLVIHPQTSTVAHLKILNLPIGVSELQMISHCFMCLVPHHKSTLVWLQWRHNEHDGVLNHHPHGCLLYRLFRRRSKKTSKLRVTGLCEGNLPVTGEFPAQRANNAEKCFHLMTSSWTSGITFQMLHELHHYTDRFFHVMTTIIYFVTFRHILTS